MIELHEVCGAADERPDPDEKTIWLFREKMTQGGVIERLFDRFRQYLEAQGVIAHTGSIIDASFVYVPRQRNSKEENQKIKQAEVPEGWKKKPEKLRQQDVDARWPKKGNEVQYGYKDHVKIDKRSKVITTYEVTDAAEHDS